jgi:hypothetical protein
MNGWFATTTCLECLSNSHCLPDHLVFSTQEEITSGFGDQHLFTIQPAGVYELKPTFQLGRLIPVSELYPSEPRHKE